MIFAPCFNPLAVMDHEIVGNHIDCAVFRLDQYFQEAKIFCLIHELSKASKSEKKKICKKIKNLLTNILMNSISAPNLKAISFLDVNKNKK